MWSQIRSLIDEPWARAAAIAVGSLLVALVVELVVLRWVAALTRRSKTDLDDKIIAALRYPIFVSIALVGAYWASRELPLKPATATLLHNILQTIAVLFWASALTRLGTLLLRRASLRSMRLSIIQPRTVPLFDILTKILIVGGALYFVMLSWEINVTGWLASAGIVGIAVGFAAKDTLANLFAGIFILADAPYKLGDFVVLEGGERGRVTDIGMRSTRILTRDDIQITVPNAVIANAKIINETAGPYEKERVRVTVSVAYGSDVDQVRAALLSCVDGVEHVCAEPTPSVRFREFGDSGLKFQLLAWIDEPVLRGRVLDALNTRVYKRFREVGIEIPYAKRDLYIRELPATAHFPGKPISGQ